METVKNNIAKEIKKVRGYHYTPSNCFDMMEKRLPEYDESDHSRVIFRDGQAYELFKVVRNESETCPNKHNGDEYHYKIMEGVTEEDF